LIQLPDPAMTTNHGQIEQKRLLEARDCGVPWRAKASPEDILIRIIATNRGRGTVALHILPALWFRNAWSVARFTETKHPPSSGS
jgi:hypothetical protein